MNREVRNRRLVVRAGAHRCALALEDVVETLRPLPIEAVDGAPQGVRGLAVIRGVPVPVLDLAAVLGSSDAQGWTRLVSVRAGERTVALGVAGVEGVREFDPSTLNRMPPLLQRANSALVDSVSVLDNELFLVLKAACLLPEETAVPGKES